jgi:hypothetical protein
VLTAWSHPGRCRNDAAFAMLAGAAPIPASSGKTVRYRLNRSGNRQLNRALHNIALSRLRYDPDTRAYADRRRAQGKTDRDIPPGASGRFATLRATRPRGPTATEPQKAQRPGGACSGLQGRTRVRDRIGSTISARMWPGDVGGPRRIPRSRWRH